eukprot:TRINITY_DN4976_c0_g1_i9.p2 TRINITY_DN4976_c0_g1~~TRINITY_DN4976_c0_g1_i9.p2  ORF type:complete len:112 (-),score=35.99 TRINITY_DN4976_c0_g1_i9:183-518(-)
MFFFLMIRRPPRSTQSRSSAASDVYKRQTWGQLRKFLIRVRQSRIPGSAVILSLIRKMTSHFLSSAAMDKQGERKKFNRIVMMVDFTNRIQEQILYSIIRHETYRRANSVS